MNQSCGAAGTPITPSSEAVAEAIAQWDSHEVDKQDGRRFSGTFSSVRGNDPLIGVISRSGAIYVVDDDGYTVGTVLAPNRIELCYMMLSRATRIASCVELTKQP